MRPDAGVLLWADLRLLKGPSSSDVVRSTYSCPLICSAGLQVNGQFLSETYSGGLRTVKELIIQLYL